MDTETEIILGAETGALFGWALGLAAIVLLMPSDPPQFWNDLYPDPDTD